MNNISLMQPMAIQICLMIIMTLALGLTRFIAVRRRQVTIKDVVAKNWPGRVKLIGENYANQYEAPILFFVMCLMAMHLGIADKGFLIAAWAFVILRILHAMIHIGYNNVMHRFIVFVAGILTLTYMMLRLVLAVF